MSSVPDPKKLRNLKIKTGVVKRYTKEKQSYEKEADDQKKKIEKFENEGKDELFLRQQKNCLQESEMMVPEIQRKLLSAFDELRELTVSSDSKSLEDTEEYKQAISILQEAKPHLPQPTTK